MEQIKLKSSTSKAGKLEVEVDKLKKEILVLKNDISAINKKLNLETGITVDKYLTNQNITDPGGVNSTSLMFA